MNYEQKLEKYLSLVKKGCTTKEICTYLNVTRRTVLNYSKKTGIKPKSGKKKPDFNYNYFEEIDTEEKAYMLGFISADGYISSNERALSFQINKKDIDIIKKFDKEIGANSNVTKSSTENCIRVNYCSKKMVNDLSKYGIVRNKTKKIKIPNIKKDLIKHFIRGFVDGDGCIGKGQVAITIGSENMFKSLMKVFESLNCGEVYGVKNKEYFTIQLSRRNSKIIKWLYEDSNIYLDRKYDSYVQNWKYYTEKIRSRG